MGRDKEGGEDLNIKKSRKLSYLYSRYTFKMYGHRKRRFSSTLE